MRKLLIVPAILAMTCMSGSAFAQSVALLMVGLLLSFPLSPPSAVRL